MKKLFVCLIALIFSAVPAFAGVTVIAPPPGWTLISSAAISGSSVAFTGVPSSVNDLLLVANAYTAGGGNVQFKVNSAAWSSSNITTCGGGDCTTTFLLTGIQKTVPQLVIGAYGTGSGPITCASMANSCVQSSLSTPVTGVELVVAGGTFGGSGIAYLYGR